VLARSDVGKVVGEPAIAKHATGCRLQNALRALQNQHVISAAARRVDARDHRNEKHLADTLAVVAFVDAEIIGQPSLPTCLSIPLHPDKLMPDRLNLAFAPTDLDRLVHHVLPEPTQSLPL